VRRALPLTAVIAVLAGAAGGCAAEEASSVAQIRPWPADAPYLPPRAPRSAAGEPVPEAVPAPRGQDDVASGAPTDAEVRADLREGFGTSDAVDRASIGPGGLAVAPPSAPAQVQAIISAANQVARKPYVYGGGHGGGPEGLFVDTAYDCSGSISYALAAAGLIESPMASGPMMTWGRKGKGDWVTIYANEGHAFMVVAGLRFDTSGMKQAGTRWQVAPRSVSGMVARHPRGL
jgi:cell wall-associated NlpC family hydrolase